MNTPEAQNARVPPLPAAPTPPPPPAPLYAASRREPDRAQREFGEEFKPLEHLTLPAVIDALLKRPARIAYEVLHGASDRVRRLLLGTALAGLLVYGVVMGCFSGGQQLWVVPVKVMAGVTLSAIICLPSLYILSAMAGSRITIVGAWGVLLSGLGLTALLLAGFAPVAWLFSQSTGTVAWMGFLHILLWVAALGFGYRPMALSLASQGGRASGVLRLWAVVFFAVLMQMATVLRPVVGAYKPSQFGQKLFFLQHWGETLSRHGNADRK